MYGVHIGDKLSSAVTRLNINGYKLLNYISKSCYGNDTKRGERIVLLYKAESRTTICLMYIGEGHISGVGAYSDPYAP